MVNNFYFNISLEKNNYHQVCLCGCGQILFVCSIEIQQGLINGFGWELQLFLGITILGIYLIMCLQFI